MKPALALIALTAISAAYAAAQDASSVVKSALDAMGGGDLRNIQISGVHALPGDSGSYVAALGQSFDVSRPVVAGVQPAPGENYPQFEVTRYTRLIDFGAMSSSEVMTRRQGFNPALGGGGTPLIGEQQSVSNVRGSLAWNVQGAEIVPMPTQAETRQLEILLTPVGFLRGALAAGSNATVFRRRHFANRLGSVSQGRPVTIVSFTALGKYRVNGTLNDENHVENVQTWIPNPVLGDMLYEVRYEVYKDFGGVMYPTVAHAHQGNRFVTLAHDAWELRIADVRKNVAVPVPDVPDAVRRATVPPVRVESQKLADGVWLMGGGTHNSVAVEFTDFVAVVEAPLNEARSLAVIAEVGRLAPNKPIRYVVNTHHHFDHSGGLRTYVSEGAQVVTHVGNRHFYENVLLSTAPRTLDPDRLSLYPIPTRLLTPPALETVNQKYVISDGTRMLDVYPVQGDLTHSSNMLVAYLPTEKILINGDLYTPPTAGAQPPASPTPAMTVLQENIQRLKLSVVQHVPIHGRVGAQEEFLKLVGEARH